MSIKSAFERKRMCDEMFSLFQKVCLVDVERAAEKNSMFDQRDRYEELKKVTQPYCVSDLAKCTINEYHQAFMNKIERLEIADASNKKEVCMALIDGYIEPIHLMLTKDERVEERKHLYFNVMTIQIQAMTLPLFFLTHLTPAIEDKEPRSRNSLGCLLE